MVRTTAWNSQSNFCTRPGKWSRTSTPAENAFSPAPRISRRPVPGSASAAFQAGFQFSERSDVQDVERGTVDDQPRDSILSLKENRGGTGLRCGHYVKHLGGAVPRASLEGSNTSLLGARSQEPE